MKKKASASVWPAMRAAIGVLIAFLTFLPTKSNAAPVLSVSLPPTSTTIEEDTGFTIPALMFFTVNEEDLNSTNVTIYMQPSVGLAEVDPETGDIGFTPAENDFGSRVIGYQACNALGNCSQVVNFTVNITPVNDPPVFGVTNLTVLEDTVVSLVLPGDLNATDPEDALNADSFSIVSPPGVGTLEYSGGVLVYRPPLNYFTTAGRPVTFELMVCDADPIRPLCLVEVISINLTPVYDNGAVDLYLPANSSAIDADNFADQFFIVLVSEAVNGAPDTITLSVTTRSPEPVLFEVVAENFHVVAAVSLGDFTRVQLDPSLILIDSNDRDKGILLRSLNGEKIAAYLTYTDTFQHDSMLLLPTPPDVLDFYTYMVISRADTIVPGEYLAVLVATENDTEIQLLSDFPVQIGTGNTLTLHRLQTLAISHSRDFTGTRVISNKPLSFFCGHHSASVGENSQPDLHFQQVLPVEYWGSRFVLAAPASEQPVSYRVVSGLECTTVHLTCKQNETSPVRVSSFSLNVTEFFDIPSDNVTVPSGHACWLESYYPVFVMQYATGGSPQSASSVIVPPVNQYSNSYVLSREFPSVVLMVPAEHYRLDLIFLDGSPLNLSAVLISSVVHEGLARAYAIRLTLSGARDATLYHASPSAVLGVLLYRFDGFFSYAQAGGLHQAIWTGDNLFRLSIAHLDESTVTITWVQPIPSVFSYSYTLTRNDVGAVVESAATAHLSVSFVDLRQLTSYTLTVVANLNETLKLPLLNSTTFRTDPCPNSADVIFLVDASDSVSTQEFEVFRDFVGNVSEGLKFGENWTRVGVITFGGSTHDTIPLDKYFDGESFRSAVQALTHSGTAANLANAIAAAEASFGGSFGARGDAVSLVILLTATLPDPATIEPVAQSAIRSGVTIYTVGFGLEPSQLLPTVRSDQAEESDDSRVYGAPGNQALHMLSVDFAVKFSDCFCSPPCLNDGVCIKSLYCNCTDGWAGIACHTLDPTLFRFQKLSEPVGILEGTQDTYSVWLNRPIYSDVFLDIMSTDNFSQVLTSRFVFNATNWMQPQVLSVLGVDDVIDKEDVYRSVLSVTTVSTNKLYHSQNHVHIAVLDTDEPGVIVVAAEAYPDSTDIPEGRWRTYHVTLPNRPFSPVVVLFFPIDTSFVSVYPTYMVFEPEDWNLPKILVVTATNDDVVVDSPYHANLGMTLFSMDENFHGAPVPELMLSMEDNDYGDAILSGSLSWQRMITPSRRTAARFTLTLTLAIATVSNASVGDELQIPRQQFFYGDDSSDGGPLFQVAEIVRDRGYLVVVGSFTHEYSTSVGRLGPWKAWFQYCCRRGDLANNKHTLLTLSALVNLQYQTSPVVPVLPIVDLQVSNANQSFHFVALSRGNPLRYSVADSWHYHSSQAGAPQCVGMDPVTGRISWDTSGASAGSYSLHIVTEDLFSGVNVTTELHLRIQPAASQPLDSAPVLSASSHALPPLVHVLEANRSFSLNVSTLLRGGHFDPDVAVLPLTLPPAGLLAMTTEVEWMQEDDGTSGSSELVNLTAITSTVEWTPAPSQVGDTSVCLVAISTTGQLSPPHCLWLRVFSSPVYAPMVSFYGNGDFPQVFNQSYTAEEEPYRVAAFSPNSEIQLLSMPTIEHMEVSVTGAADGESEILSVNASFTFSTVSFESRSFAGRPNVIVFRGRASSTDYSAALRSVLYSNSRRLPTVGVRPIVVSVYDGISSNPLGAAYTEMSVAVPARPPRVSTSGGGEDRSHRTTFYPGGASVPVLDPSLAYVADRDSPTLSSATLALQHTADSSDERLRVTHASIEALNLPVIAERLNVNKPFGRLQSGELVSSVSDTLSVGEAGLVGDVEVVVDIRHSWLGDLKVELRHAGRTETLTSSPGGLHCSRDTLYRTVFDSHTGSGVNLEKEPPTPGVCRFRSEGVFRPYGNLDGFVGLPIEGDWSLSVSDFVLENDNGRIVSWSVVIQPTETHLRLTTPPVVPLLSVGGAGVSRSENHKKWIESDGRITGVSVHVQLAHPYTSEVLYTPTLILTHPDGTAVQLSDSADTFCAYGNYTYLVFDDRGNETVKKQYIDACANFQNETQSGNTASTMVGTVVGMGSDSSSMMNIGMENVSAVLDFFNIGYESPILVPSYPVKTSLVDLLLPAQPLAALQGKMLKGEWMLTIFSQTEPVTLLGWSVRLSREPNIDHTYDSVSQTLSFTGLDSPANYETVLKSVMYENSRDRPSLESLRVVQLSVSDGQLYSNISSPSSETFILVHHIEINLDPTNSTNASFPHIQQQFVEMQDPLHIADPHYSILSDPSFDIGLYRIEFTIEGYSNYEMEGLFVDLDGTGLSETFLVINATNETTYTLSLTVVVPTPISALQTVLRNIVYFNSAEELEGEKRVIVIQVTDESGPYFSLVARSGIEFVPTNDAPVLILNSVLHSDGYSNIVNFVEGQGPVLLAHPDNIVLYDHDHDFLTKVTIKLTNSYDGENDTLLVNVAGTGINGEYNSSLQQLILTGRDSVTNYTSVLTTVAYNNLLHSPGNPDTRQRVISFVPYDGSHSGQEVVAIVTFDSVNDPPIVDLNGEGQTIDNYVTFVEERGWVSLAANATLFDIDDSVLSFIEIELMNCMDCALERLAVDNVTVTVSASSAYLQQYHVLSRSDYDVSTGVLRIEPSQPTSIADMQRVLRTLRYNNMADEPDLTSRVVKVTASDGALRGPSAYVYLLIEAVNDSPYFRPDALPFAPVMYEDEPLDVNDGFSVSDIARLISDDDQGAEGGVAVVGLDATHGRWDFRLSTGSWTPIPPNVSLGMALLLSNTDGNNLRFVPEQDFNGLTTISFVAWDVTNSNTTSRNSSEIYQLIPADNATNSSDSSEFVFILAYELTNLDGMFTNAQSQSDIDPYSNSTLVVTLEIVPVNDAPVISNETVHLTSIREDDFTSAGDAVSELLNSAQDVDGMDSVGVAVVSADQGDGVWQYAGENRSSWTNFGLVSLGAALVLSQTDTVRFVPAGDFNGIVSFGYLAWDMTDDLLSGSRSVNTTMHDDVIGSYSSQNNTAYVTIEPVNDSPVVSDGMTMESILEDSEPEMIHGTNVARILSGRYTDVDEGFEEGLSVVAVDNRFGQWEYTCGSSPFAWQPFIGDRVYGVIVPSLPLPEKATLLNASCHIRFLPEMHFNTEFDYDGYPRPTSDVPYIEVRGWDNTGETLGRSGTYGNDASYAERSHTNEYSSERVRVTIAVLSINDPPMLSLFNESSPNFEATFIEDGLPVLAVGEDASLIDNDHLRLKMANVTLYGSYGTPEGGYLGLTEPQASDSGLAGTVPNKPSRVFSSAYLEEYCKLNSSVERREELQFNTQQTDLEVTVVSICPYSVIISPNVMFGNDTIHKAQFEKVLKSLKYSNTIEEPVGGVRIIEFSVSDGIDLSTLVYSSITVEIVNDEPQLDLNSFVSDVNNNVLFVEGSGAVLLANFTGLTLIDHDDNYLQNASVELFNHPDEGHEILVADVEGTNITAQYVNFTLYLEGHDTLDAYASVLTSVAYNNTYSRPGKPNESVREVRFVVSDGDKQSRVAVSFVRFEGTNDVPYLDVNGDSEGTDYTAYFVEEMGPVSLVDQNLILSDEDNASLAYITVQIETIYDPGLEVLEVDNVTLSSIQMRNSRNQAQVVELRHIIPLVSYNASIGLLTISGLENLEDYRSILRTVTYNNLADEPALTPREVVFTLYDGLLESAPVNTTVNMVSENDSPRFNNLSVIEPSADEDQVASFTVYDMAFNLIEDDDAGAEAGIAIVDVDSSNGYWQFILGGSTSARSNISVTHRMHDDLSVNHAVLLKATMDNVVQFVPNRDFNGNATITFVAWDASDGMDGAERMVLFSENGTDAFGFETRTITVQIQPVNDAPVLITSEQPRMTNIREDSVAEWPNEGDNVTRFLSALTVDVDIFPSTNVGIAVVGVDSSNGVWQFSTDAGLNWTDVPQPLDQSSALLLTAQPEGTSRIRFFPNKDFNGESSFSFKLWDLTSNHSSGDAGVDTAAADPVTGAFSVDSTSAHITVEPVNDSPVLSGNTELISVNEDIADMNNIGTLVSTILRPIYSDVDVPSAVEVGGLAVVEVDLRFGIWYYTCASGSTVQRNPFIGNKVFEQIAPRTPHPQTATLLLSSCSIIFAPNDNFNSRYTETGSPRDASDTPYIRIRGWDNTGATEGFNSRYGINTTSDPDNHTNSFSQETVLATIDVLPINDPVVLRLGSSTKSHLATFVEPIPPQRTVVPVPIVDLEGLLLTDVDNAFLESMRISFVRFDGEQETISISTSGTGLQFSNSSNSTTGEFTIDIFPSGHISEFRSVLLSALYSNSAEEPNHANRTVTITVTDTGTGGVFPGSDVAVTTVRIQRVNDPPELDLDSTLPDLYSFVRYTEGESPVVLLPNPSLVDHDSPLLANATVSIVSAPDMRSEILTANATGTLVAWTYDNETGVLQLAGLASVSDYAAVLATVSYGNTLANPGNPSDSNRVIEFVVSDGLDNSILAVAMVMFTAVNNQPFLDVNGNSNGTTYFASFVEGGTEVRAVDENLVLQDVDNETLLYIEVTITDLRDEGLEFLRVEDEVREIRGDPTSGHYSVWIFTPTQVYNASSGTLTISNLRYVHDYQEVLKTLTYYNQAEEPLGLSRTLRFDAFDGLRHSLPVYTELALVPINDSPYFNSSVDVITPSIYEDIPTSENRGYSLEEFAAGLILDNDRDAVKGIAVIGADSQFGRWEYSTDFVSLTATVESNSTALDNSTINDTVSATGYSASWEPIPENTSISSSVVLLVSGEQTRVRFVPNKNFNGQTALTFVAWDASDDSRLMDGDITDASDQSDQDPFSSGHRVLVVRVNRTNDAPLLSPLVSFNLSSILEDDRDSAGDPVEELLRGVSEVDLVDKEHGIAVVGALQWLGEWQFSVDGGHSWTGVGNVSLRSAVLLRSSPPGENRIRFVPQMDFNGYSQVSFVAWDLTSGEPSGTSGVDVMSSDPVQGAFSRNMTTAMILVEPVNDSPHLSEGSVLLTISEDLPVGANNGTSVMDLLNGTFSDVDEDPVLNYQPYTDIGVAVVGVDPRYGEWQYWCPGFTDWRVFIGDFIYGVTLPLYPRVEKATLLLSTCRVRFLPDLHFNSLKDLDGEYRPGVDVPFITIRAWDNTGLSAGQSGGYGRNTAYNQDSATNEFSSETYSATINVTSVNDEPLLNISAVGDGETFRTEFVEDSQYVHITDPSSVRLVDFDNARLESLSVRIENSIDPDSELIDIVGDNSTVEVSGSAVVVRVSGREYHLQTMLNIYSNTSLSAESSLLVMSSPGRESASVEAYQLLIQHLVYRNLHPEPTNGTRQLSFKVDDGESVNTRVRTFVEVTLRAENIPVIMLARRMVFFTEGQPPTSLTSPQLLLTDRDHNEFFFMSEAVLTFLARPGSSLERLSVDLSTVPAEHSLEQRYFPESGSLVVSGEAPVSVYQDVLRSAAYGNTEEEPLPGQRIVSVLVTDNHNLSSKAVFVVIEVTSINDRAPEISAPMAAYTFVEGSGCVLLSGVSISDNDAGDSDLSVYSFNATISNPFDGTEEYLTTERFSNVFVTEEDNRVELRGPASLEDFRKALSTLRYCNTAEEPVPSVRYIDLVVRDANFTSEEVTITVEFTLVNDQPVIDLNGPLVPDVDFITNYVEGSGAQLIVDAENLTVSDNDHSYLLSVTVVLGEVYDAPLELLSVDPGLVEAANISSAYNSSSGVLVLSDRASLQAYQSVLRTLSYQNQEAMPGLPTTLMREVTLVAFDGHAHSNISTSYITFNSVNDAPFFDLNGNQFGRNYSIAFTEEGPAVLITAADMTLSDVDNTSLQSVTVSITNRLDGELEGLSLSSDSSLEGVLTLTGLGGLEGFRDAVSRLRYQNLADEPQFEDRVIEFIANDGLLDSLPFYTTVSLIPVNDPPRFQIQVTSNVTVPTANATEPGDGRMDSVFNDTTLNGTMVNSTVGSDMTDDDNASVALPRVPFSPAPYFAIYTENDFAMPLTNPSAVLVIDDDDMFLTEISITTSGVRDPGHESIFFKLPQSSDLARKLDPYDFEACPHGEEHYTSFKVTKTLTLSEVREALQSLHYCNSDEFSLSGPRTVSITVRDTAGAVSEPQVAHVDVTAVNDAPQLRTDVMVISMVTIDEDGNYTLPALSFFLDHEEELTASAIQIVMVDPDVGTAEVDLETGDIAYSSAPDDYGVRTVWYQACDSQGSCSSPVSLVVVINPVNDAPRPALKLEFTILEDTPTVLDYDSFFSDPEDDANENLTSTVTLNEEIGLSFTVDPQNATSIILTSAPNNTDGGIVNFTVCDSDNACTVIVVAIRVTPVNDKPEIYPVYPSGAETISTFEDTSVSIPVRVRDIEDIDYLSVTFVKSGHGSAVGSLDGATSSKSNVFEQNSFVIYTPDENFCGHDLLTVRATDAEGKFCDTEISITVECVNDPPVFGVTSLTVLEDTVVSLVLPGDLNATDPEDALNADSFSIVSLPGVGTLEYSGGLLVYRPPQHYHNVSDPVTFVLMGCDNDTTAPICVNQTISITYLSVNDAPLLPPINVSIYEDSEYVTDLTTMIDDIEDMSVASERIRLLDPSPQHGAVAYNSSTGILTYVPDENYFGGDVIVFQACDSEGNCSRSGVVNVDVLPVNDPPEAGNFTANVTEDEYDLIAVDMHISDLESDPSHINQLLKLHLVDSTGQYLDRLVSPANASLRVFDAHGIIGYEPMSEFVGVDFLTFAVCDVCHTSRSGALGRVDLPPECLRQIEESGGGSLHSDNTNITCVERQVRVVVRNVDDVPHISDISAVVMIGGSVRVSPFEESRVPAANGSNLYLYTNSSRPVFEQDDLQMTIAASLGLDLTELQLHSDSDIDEESLLFSNPSNGTVEVARDSLGLPHFVYTPDNLFQGYDSFKYEVCDKIRDGDVSTRHCSEATARIFVFGPAPNISSVVAISSQMLLQQQSQTTADDELVDIDSKVSRGDRILINFASPTNMPPHGKASMTVTQQEIDAIFVFGRPFILPEIAPIGYEGRWNNATQFEVEILDEGYPQPEIVVGQWWVSVREGVSPCGGFNPVSRSPEPVDSSCLQDAAGTSFHSITTSEPISGSFGVTVPLLDAVNIIPDTHSKRDDPSKDIFVNTLIALYLKEPLSHYQLQQYCSQDPRSILNPDLVVGPGAKLSISGCQNLMPSSENAEVVYRDKIARYEQEYPSQSSSSESNQQPNRKRRNTGLTVLPSQSEIILKVVGMSSGAAVPIDDAFAPLIERAFNYETLARVVANATGVDMQFLSYPALDDGPRVSGLGVSIQHSASTTPSIANVTGTSDDLQFNAGDTIKITFDRDTNQPPVTTPADVDKVFVFDPPLGSNYGGLWLDSRTMELTIYSGGGETIETDRFTISFTDTSPPSFPSNLPHCVSVGGTEGVCRGATSNGVCDVDELSCRSFRPWTGLTIVTVTVPTVQTNTVAIVVPIVIVFLLILLAIAIAICVYWVYKRWKKRRDQNKAQELVKKWREDKDAPGKDDKEGPKPWAHPPDVPVMRPHVDPFSVDRDGATADEDGPSAGPDPFKNLPDIRPPTAQPSENLPPIPPHRFAPRSMPRIGSPASTPGPLSMPPRLEPRELGLPALTKQPSREPMSLQLPPLKGNLGAAGKKVLGPSGTSDSSATSVPGALRPSRLPSLSNATSPVEGTIKPAPSLYEKNSLVPIDGRGKGPSNGKRAFKKVSPDVTTEEETQDSGSDKGETPRPSPMMMSPPKRAPPPALPGLARLPKLPQTGATSPPPMSPPGIMSPRRPQVDPFGSLPSPPSRPGTQQSRGLPLTRPIVKDQPKPSQ